MLTGAHFLLYSKDPEADRAFFRDVLQFRFVELGGNWLIFALPPAELAVHPATENFVQMHGDRPMLGAILYLMCDDLPAMMKGLTERGVHCSSVIEADWGKSTSLRLPSGGEIGLYQPTHATAIGLSAG
jgi:catechol 2,3-dioxygenase-like lactoylglutathione lyase family enzyme